MAQLALALLDRGQRLVVGRGLALARRGDGQEVERQRAALAGGQHHVGEALRGQRRGGEDRRAADRERGLHLVVDRQGRPAQDRAELLDRVRGRGSAGRVRGRGGSGSGGGGGS